MIVINYAWLNSVMFTETLGCCDIIQTYVMSFRIITYCQATYFALAHGR